MSLQEKTKAWLQTQLTGADNLPHAHTSVWRTVGRRRGFSRRRSRLVYKGRLIPWEKTHEAFASHLEKTQPWILCKSSRNTITFSRWTIKPPTRFALHETQDWTELLLVRLLWGILATPPAGKRNLDQKSGLKRMLSACIKVKLTLRRPPTSLLNTL